MTKNVGLIGAGRMGMPIIGHLVRAGFSVRVNDLNPAKRAPVVAAGATWSVDTAELARDSEFVLVCVGYDRELRELLAAGGPLRQAAPGSIVVILSTVLPQTVQDLAADLIGADLHVIDATVCRGGEAADKGTLLSFVGGTPEVVERVKPVLRAYSSDVVHTGKAGSAQVAKAVNNMILWACLVADHEGLALANAYGLEIEPLRQALMVSSCVNGALGNWGKQSMAWAEDDMAIVGEMANAVGLGLPQAGVVREICRPLKPRRYKLEAYGR